MAGIRRLISAARGERPADIVFKNAKVVDVFSRQIIEGDLAVVEDVVAGVGTYHGEVEIDCTDKYLCPSLTDSHVHVESAFVPPAEFARAVIPHGVTSVVFDPHEIANVTGVSGIGFMLDAAESTPLDFHLMVPSCVPATKYDPSGAILDSSSVEFLMPRATGLAEMMDYEALLNGDEEVIRKLECSPFVDGHAPFLSDKDLNAYAAAGVRTDHECSTGQELLDRIARGMYVQLREGSYSKNLEALLPYVNEKNLSRCLLCTDDRFIADILAEGSIDNAIRKAISLGMDPIAAIVMASTNPAQCYGFAKRGSLAPGRFADLLVLSDLEAFQVEEVYKDGVLIAKDGEPCFTVIESRELPLTVTDTVHTPTITVQTFGADPEPGQTAIKLGENDLTTSAVTLSAEDISAGSYTRLAVIERHGKSGSVGTGFVSNYGMKNGAIASTVSHDSHNLIVIGDNSADMQKAVEVLGTEGGIALVSNGEVLGHLPLPIAGLMSELSGAEVSRIHDEIEEHAHNMGVPKTIDPIMALEFVSLPVIPEIRLTAHGLFDVTTMSYLDVSPQDETTRIFTQIPSESLSSASIEPLPLGREWDQAQVRDQE